MKIEDIKLAVESIAQKYSIKKAILFGSMANGTNTSQSDVDLIIEFSGNVSLITISSLKIELEEILKKDVDIIHGPITNKDFIDVNEEVELYAA